MQVFIYRDPSDGQVMFFDHQLIDEERSLWAQGGLEPLGYTEQTMTTVEPAAPPEGE